MKLHRKIGIIKTIIIVILIAMIEIVFLMKNETSTKHPAISSVDSIRIAQSAVKGIKPQIVKIQMIKWLKPKSITKDSLIPVYTKVDSSLLLEKYYATKVSYGVIQVDPGYTNVITVDSISRNRIFSRRSFVHTIKPRNNRINVLIVEEATKAPIVEPTPKTREWYAGLGTSVNGSGFNSLYGSALLKNKRNEIFQLNLGISNMSPLGDYRPFIGASAHFKIK
jgi:hypothetical protein